MQGSGVTIPTVDLIIVAVYLLGILTIGILVGYKKRVGSEDFFLAGKSLRWPIIGAALFTANISTIHLVGLAAEGYRIGLVVGNFDGFIYANYPRTCFRPYLYPKQDRYLA